MGRAWDPLGHVIPAIMFIWLGIALTFGCFFKRKYYLGLTYCIVILATTGIIFETWWERWRLHSVLYYQHITMYAFFNIFGLSRYFVTKIGVLNGKSSKVNYLVSSRLEPLE